MREIAAHDLAVIEVELQAHVRPAHLTQHLRRLRQRRERVPRHVPTVERLDHDTGAERCGLIRGPLKIAHVG